MKNIHRLLTALCVFGASLAYGQISTFTVTSLSGPGNDVQISGLMTTAPALVQIQSGSPSLGVNNMTPYFGNYYTIQAGVGGTALAYTAGGYSWYSTTVTNQYAPNIGFPHPAPLFNCSGRFRIEAPTTTYDEWGNPQTEGGTEGYLQFTLTEARSISIDVLGSSRLAPYGLSGAQAPVVSISNGSQITGETAGAQNIGVLQPGTYYLTISAEADTGAGLVTVSVFAN